MAVELHSGDTSHHSSSSINTNSSPLNPHFPQSSNTQGKKDMDNDDDLLAELTHQMQMAQFMLQEDNKFDFPGIGSENLEPVQHTHSVYTLFFFLLCLTSIVKTEKVLSCFILYLRFSFNHL